MCTFSQTYFKQHFELVLKERLQDNYDKLVKKLKSLKKIHYTCFVVAKDSVKTVERREGDQNVLFTQQKKDEEEVITITHFF